MKISLRLTLTAFLVVFFLLASGAVVFYTASRSLILRAERDDILSRLREPRGRMEHRMVRGRPIPPDFLAGIQQGGELAVFQDPWGLSAGNWKEGLVFEEGEHFLFIAFPVAEEGELLVGKNITPSMVSLSGIGRLFLWAVPLAAAVAFTLSFLLAEHQLRPLRAINKRLCKLGTEELGDRFAVTEKGDEVSDLKESLNRMLEGLEEAYALKKHFAENVSHQLRTPLSAIMGYAELLRRWGGRDPEITTESIEAIEKAGKEMRELIEGLLAVARGEEHIVKSEIDADQFLNELCRRFGGRFPGRKITCTAREGAKWMSSAVHLRILLDVLMENALKHTDGPVEVRSGEGSIEVRDQGQGVSPEELSRWKERFPREGKANRPAWGLGVPLALDLARILDLELTFRNLPEGGFMARVRFGSEDA